MAFRTGWALAYAASVGVWALVRWPAYHAGPPEDARPVGEAILFGLATALLGLAAGRMRMHPLGAVRPKGAALGASACTGIMLLALAAAAGWLAAETWSRDAWRLAPWEGGEPVTVTGYLEDAERLVVTGVNGVPVRSRVRVRWGQGEAGRGGGGSLFPGVAVEVTGTLRRLRPATNPGGYDDRAAGLRQGYAFELRATGPARVTGPPGPVALAARGLAGLRQALEDGLALALPPGPQGVAAALLLDQRAGLSVTARDALAATGLIHALAVSGQHVAMAAALAAWTAGCARWLPRRRRLGVMGVVVLYAGLTGGPPSVLRATATFLLAEAARALARPVSAVETLAWAGFLQAARRPLVLLDPGFQLSFAATAGLILLGGPLQRAWRRRWNQWTVTAAPGGTGRSLPGTRDDARRIAGWAGRALRQLGGWAGDALAVTLAAQLAVLPVQAGLFGRAPVLALVANLVVVPLSAVALAAAAAAAAWGALLVLLPLPSTWDEPVTLAARIAGWPAAASLTAMVRAAMVAGALPAAAGDVAPAAAGCVAFGAGWILWQLGDGRPAYARRLRPRHLPPVRLLVPAGAAAAGALLLSTLLHRPPPAGAWVAWFLDVGQGDAILLQFPGGRSALVDSGGKALRSEGARYWPGPPPAVPDAVGEQVTVPVVRRLLGRGPDLLAVTHADRDHAGGAAAVLEHLGAGMVWLGGVPGAVLDRTLVAVAARHGVPLQRPAAGWQWQPAPGCRVDVLHPQEPGGGVSPIPGAEGGATGQASASENDRSLVLRVGCGGPRLLLVGDLERAGEEELLRRGVDLHAEVLKVSHHGSRGATTAAFLAAVAPRLAVVSSGPNPYGLPHVETLARLQRAGIAVLRTDQVGAVAIRAGPGNRLEVRVMVPGGGNGR